MLERSWPAEGATRVPYWVYQDEDIYHDWTYDHAGNLTNVAFRKGIGGKGGMAADARPESQAPKKLRVAAIHGIVFGTLSESTPPLAQYIGPQILPRLARVMIKPVK